MAAMRYEGKLKKWNVERGFGFIVANDSGQDIFVHSTVRRLTEKYASWAGEISARSSKESCIWPASSWPTALNFQSAPMRFPKKVAIQTI